jgi:uncharacterized damage-inducible protein DinB
MSQTTLTAVTSPDLAAAELLQWSDETFAHWEELLKAHPEALDLPCDIYGSTKDVRGLLVHIVAVELRYAERLRGEPVTPYEQIPNESVEAIFATHRRTVEKLRALLASGEGWDGVLESVTLTAGTLRTSRRKIFIHALTHGIRHFAQLATLVRQHGIKPDWHMDFLVSSAME